MQIGKYDKLLRLQYLNTSMPPLRFTRLSKLDLKEHLKQLREFGVSQEKKEQCRARFFREFSRN